MQDPEFIDLEKLFHRRLFKIPQYQRSYSWQKKQRKDLLNDIKISFEKNSQTHFMATVVGLKQGDPKRIVADEYQTIDIVDGQQRITTLIMLYKAISKKLDRDDNEIAIRNELTKTLVKDDNASVLLLQTNHDTSNYFLNYIRKGTIRDDPATAETSADRNILAAIIDCEEFVEKWRKDGCSLIDLIVHIKNRLTFIYHEIDDESLVYTVFEVLNSRGLEVSRFDRFKSILMSKLFDQECTNSDTLDEIHNRWASIFKTIGTLPISTEILRSAATLYEHDKSKMRSEEKSVELLVRKSSDGCEKIIETTDWIERVTRSVVKIHNSKREVTVGKISQARLVAVAIDLRDDLSSDAKKELSNYLEKITFCIYGLCKYDSRNDVGKYVRLAYEINNNNTTAKNIKTELASIMNAHPINEKIDSLVTEDCYNKWENALRYLLYRYEEYLSKESGQSITNEQWNRIWEASVSKSIEHILPQSSKKPYVHWLGNLLLLPPNLNAELKDKPPVDKAEKYNQTGLLIAQKVANNLTEWNEAQISERGRKIARWAKKEWGSL